MIWFGWVLWYINHCRLLNAKSSLYIYIKYIGFGLVGFYGISTIVGFLIPLYTYISNIYMICKHILSITFLNQPEQFFCSQLNGFKYCFAHMAGAVEYTDCTSAEE